LFIGMFIDAIPAITILGTVLWPLAELAGLHPTHFAIIGVISLAFGLVTPPDAWGDDDAVRNMIPAKNPAGLYGFDVNRWRIFGKKRPT
jgi:hypothetical protein